MATASMCVSFFILNTLGFGAGVDNWVVLETGH